MPFEIEAKYRLARGSETLRAMLHERGAVPIEGFRIVDTYLRHPSRDFAQTGEAFRVRREGNRNHLTYKAPKFNTEGVRSRPEIEVELAGDPSTYLQTLSMFQAMGFEPVATLHKFRQPNKIEWNGQNLKVEIDDAGELGLYAEIEVLLENPNEVPAAEAAIKSLANELGLTEYEPRSYLRMWLERQGMI